MATTYSVLFQKQNRDVLNKLGIATVLMFSLPIIGFYVALHLVFPHKQDPTAWAGAVAIILANVVVAGYVYSAFNEEDDSVPSEQEGEQTKKDGDEAGPRVGAFKQRTD